MKEGKVKIYLQNRDFQMEMRAKNDTISALQNYFKEISSKHEKVLVQQKKSCLKKTMSLPE